MKMESEERKTKRQMECGGRRGEKEAPFRLSRRWNYAGRKIDGVGGVEDVTGERTRLACLLRGATGTGKVLRRCKEGRRYRQARDGY